MKSLKNIITVLDELIGSFIIGLIVIDENKVRERDILCSHTKNIQKVFLSNQTREIL